MKNYFDLVIKKVSSVLSHPKNPWQLVEEVVDIGITDGHIAHIGDISSANAKNVFYAKGLTLLPGLIDTQVHFRQPGWEHKEDIATGSRSALKGGITAFLEMPNTSPPTLTAELLKNKIQIATNNSWCDFAFFIGAGESNILQLPKLEQEKGCCGIKIFMGQSTGSLLLSKTSYLKQVLQTTTKPIAIHSEDQNRLMERKTKILQNTPSVSVAHHPVWRDEDTAYIATKNIVNLAEQTKRKIHILHVTTEQEALFLAQNKHVATMEVTPQHLTLHAPDCYEQLGTLAQMNPPIRNLNHQKALWQAVLNNTVTMIGSDHAPHTLKEKSQPYPKSPAGMPGTQTMLTIMLDHVHNKRLSLKKLTQLLAVNPCRHYGFQKQGLIKKGFKANLTFVDLKKTQPITKKWLASKCDWSPFENKKTTGWPVHVMLKGKWAVKDAEIIAPAKGEMITFTKHNTNYNGN